MKKSVISVSFFSLFFLVFFFFATECSQVNILFYLYMSGDGFYDQAAKSGGFSFNLRFLFQNRVNLFSRSKFKRDIKMHSLDDHGRT